MRNERLMSCLEYPDFIHQTIASLRCAIYSTTFNCPIGLSFYLVYVKQGSHFLFENKILIPVTHPGLSEDVTSSPVRLHICAVTYMTEISLRVT